MKRLERDIAAIGVILLFVGIFFFRLFYPEISLIVTPDFGRSDAWHSSIAMKFILSESLKSGSLPIWRSDLAHGTPLLAEGETGAYFLPNLLLFSLMPPTLAYTIIVVLVIATLGLGTYVVLRILGALPISSVFAAVIMGFSALPILNLTHIALLQGMSMLPLVFAATLKLVKRGTLQWVAIVALLITQQFFAGFPQATFLTLVLCGSYVLWTRRFLLFVLSVILGILGASAQLFPSREYLSQTSHPLGFPYESAVQYSMPLKHLASFFNPFVFGNPKDGTYPPFYAFESSIFWENTGFIGWLPLIFILLSLIRLDRRKKSFFLLLVVGSVMLAWGKYSPLYVLYTIWPLNLFRVPSRFLWLTVFGFIILAGLGFDRISRRTKSGFVRLLLVIVILMSYLQLTTLWWRYHLVIPARELFATASIIEPPSNTTVFTIGYAAIHNKEFTTQGWGNHLYYRDLYRNGFTPDANAFFGVRQHEVYIGRNLYRSDLGNTLLQQTLSTSETQATLSSDVVLNLFGIKTVLSFVPVTSNTLVLTQEGNSAAGSLRMYDNPGALPKAYVTSEATSAATFTEAVSRILSKEFLPGKHVVLETRDIAANPALAQFMRQQHLPSDKPSVQVIKETHTEIIIDVNQLTVPSVLVLTDTYYPGWSATIDGKETPIYPANITQRAIVLPAQSKEVIVRYQPRSVAWGLIISLIVEFVVVLLMVAPSAVAPLGILKITRLQR